MRTWVRSSASSRVKLADRVLDGLRLGLTLWLVQFQIFLNQTVRSRKPGRIAGFVVGVVLILFWWVNIGALTLVADRSEEHTSELQSRENLVCRLLLEKKKQATSTAIKSGV